jgi:hypothetical protein
MISRTMCPNTIHRPVGRSGLSQNDIVNPNTSRRGKKGKIGTMIIIDRRGLSLPSPNGQAITVIRKMIG